MLNRIMSRVTIIQLPLEVLEAILKNLELKDLQSVMLTCKMFKDLIIKNNILWKNVCRNRMLISYNSLRRSNPHIVYNWYRISNNWCSGIYKSNIIIRHQINYIPWIIFYNSEALLVSVGSELQCFVTNKDGHPICKAPLWTVDMPTIKRNDVRTNDISRFVVNGDILICGNRDGCAAVYTIKEKNIKCKPKLLYHVQDCHENGQVEVSTVELLKNVNRITAITGSIYNCFVHFCYFDVNRDSAQNPDYFFTGCQDIKLPQDVGIRCMSLDHNQEYLAIGLNGNSKPLLLDINTGKFLITAETTINARQTIRDIRWHDEHSIVLVTHSGKLQFIDVRTNMVVYDAMDPFQSTLYCVKTDNDRAVVVGTSEYSRCVLFDTRKETSHIQMYFTQKKTSPVYSLDFDSTKLIAAADRSIALLNFNINSSSTRRDYSERFDFV